MATRNPALERPWVARILCPKQRALAHAVPALCDLCGLVPSDLEGGRRAAKNEHEQLAAGFRPIVAGALISIGYDMGLQGQDLHGPHAGDDGRTEVRELKYLHRHTLRSAIARWEEFRAGGGLVGRSFAAAFAKIRQETLLLAERFASEQAIPDSPKNPPRGPKPKKGQKTKKLGG